MARVTPGDCLAGIGRPTTEQPSIGGARQVQDPAEASAPVSLRAARAAEPGRPAVLGSPPGTAGGKTSAAALDLALGVAADHIPAGGEPSPQPSSPPAGSTPGTAGIPGGRAGERTSGNRPGRGDPGFTPPRPGQDARSWTLELPPGMPLLSLNDRLHYQERNRRARVIKEAAWVMALHGKIPRLTRARIVVEYQPPDRRHRDADNPIASAKAAVDGIVLAGVLEDDECPRYVTGIYCTIGERYPKGRLVLTVTEVGAA